MQKDFWYLMFVALLLTAGFILASEYSFYLLLVLLGVILVLFFMRYQQFGIYLIAFLFPFNYLQIVYGSINVPYSDVVAIFLFIAWFLNISFAYIFKGEKISLKNFPGWPFMLAFVFVGALSLTNVELDMLGFSFKYLLRPIIFFYLMFVFLPFNIIGSLKELYTTLKIMFLTGIGVSLMGVWSFVFPPLEGLRRAIPIEIFGVYPMGSNHNLIAEALIGIIPFAFVLFWYERDIFKKNIYLLGLFLMVGVNLLTLSRGGWLAFMIEIAILVLFRFRSKIKVFVKSYLFYLLLLLLTPVIYLMTQLFQSNVMLSSSLARLKMIEIAFYLLQKHPWIGNGVGTYTYLLSEVRWYVIEYGDIVDAHGFLFKTLPEIGILGSIAFVALLTYMVFVLLKGYANVYKTRFAILILSCLIAVVGCIVFQAFGTGYYLTKLWWPIGVSLAALKLSGAYFNKQKV